MVLMLLLWAAGLSIIAWLECFMMWTKIQDIDAAGPMSVEEGYRLLTLGITIGLGAYIAGLTLAATEEKFESWLSRYDVSQEATDSTTSVTDSKGTAIIFDMTYATASFLATYLLTSTIAVGAFAFGWMYIGADPDEVS